MRQVSHTTIGAVLLCSLRLGWSADSGSTDWTQDAIPLLNSVGKAAVVAFVNAVPGNDGNMEVAYLRDFKWVDLAGDGRAELVMITATGPCCASVVIYRRKPSGKSGRDILRNVGLDLNTGIRDLDGDGKSELIVRQDVDALDGYRGIQPAALWSAIYRLRSDKYVDASRDFASFYDAEVLPKLERRIVEARERCPRTLRASPPMRAGTPNANWRSWKWRRIRLSASWEGTQRRG